MKAFHKIAAALSTLPVAGIIALTGAGIASAATCPTGQHWNEMGGGSGFCSPDASGGGTGGNGSIDLGGGTTTTPQAPVFNPPAPYKPPVYAPAPIQPAPAPVKPVPAQKVPAQKVPVPTQVVAPPVTKERNIPVPASVKGSEVSEVASAHGKEMSEPNKAAAEAHKESAAGDPADKKIEVDETSPAPVAPTELASPTPSATPTPMTAIEASQSSASRVTDTALPAFILGGAMIVAYIVFFTIRSFRTRKLPLIESDENS